MKKTLRKVILLSALLGSLVSCGGTASSGKNLFMVGSLKEDTLYEGEEKTGVEKLSEVWSDEEKYVTLKLTFTQMTKEDYSLNVTDFKLTIDSTDYTPSMLVKRKQTSHDVGDKTKETYTETYTYINQSKEESLTGITVKSGRTNNWIYDVQFEGITSVPTSSFSVKYKDYDLKAYDSDNHFSDTDSYYAFGEDTNLYAYYGESGKTFKELSCGTRTITYKNVNEQNFSNIYKVIYVALSASNLESAMNLNASDFSLKSGDNYIAAKSFMSMTYRSTMNGNISVDTYTVKSSTSNTIELSEVLGTNLYFGSDVEVSASMPLYYQSKAVTVVSKS